MFPRISAADPLPSRVPHALPPYKRVSLIQSLQGKLPSEIVVRHIPDRSPHLPTPVIYTLIQLGARNVEGTIQTRNEIRFRNYRNFGAEVKIIEDFEGSDEDPDKKP